MSFGITFKKVNASPDIIELKCPFSAREMSIKDAGANLKDFFLGKCRHID